MDDNKNKLCPLAKDQCVEESCMWFVNGLNKCSMNVLAQAVDSMADAIEEVKDAD
jgi:hypothetical protein